MPLTAPTAYARQTKGSAANSVTDNVYIPEGRGSNYPPVKGENEIPPQSSTVTGQLQTPSVTEFVYDSRTVPESDWGPFTISEIK